MKIRLLVFESMSMFFRILIAIAVLYTLGTNAESFSKISWIAGLCSIVWIINIPFWHKYIERMVKK